jgi:hypothetical protein
MAADTGFGITIAFDSGFLAEIIDVTPPAVSREAIDTSHTATTNGKMTFMPSDLIDGGELQVEIHFVPSEVPPISSAAETVTITFGSGTTWAFSGFLTNYEPAAPIDDRMTATVTIKVSGAITIT